MQRSGSRCLILSFLLLCCVQTLPAALSAQTAGNKDAPKTASDWEKTGYFSFGASYLSDNVYLGRKDTAALPYLGPVLSYHTRSGFSLTGTLYFTNRSGDTKLDLWSLEGGYDHSFGEHWMAGGYAGSLHFQSKSNIRSDASAYAGGYIGYNNDYLTPQLEATAVFGSRTDAVAAAELSHDFGLLDDRLSIAPALKCNAGTQRYYNAFVTERLNKKGKQVSKKAVSQSDQFNILDYELSIPIAWNIRNWFVELKPIYFIPVNPTTINDGQTLVQERLGNTLVVQLSVAYRLPVRRSFSPRPAP